MYIVMRIKPLRKLKKNLIHALVFEKIMHVFFMSRYNAMHHMEYFLKDTYKNIYLFIRMEY